MQAKGANGVGRFSIDFQVANNEDVVMAKRKKLAPEKVRRVTIRGVVDTGAALLVLPKSVVKQLGLPLGDKVKVRYADHRSGTRETAEQVEVEIQGRRSTFTAIVEPSRTEALIGAIVLEALDLLPDCRHQQLVPRDPRFIISEIESELMKGGGT